MTSELGLVSRLSLECRDVALLGDLRGTLIRELAIGGSQLGTVELDVLQAASHAIRLRELRLEPYVSAAVLAKILTWFPDLETLYIGETLIASGRCASAPASS